MTKPRILLFAGTTEGRLLFSQLNNYAIPIDLSVTTEYAKDLIIENKDKNKDKDKNNIFAKRLDLDEMKNLLAQKSYSLVIDATHPYASVVTENIKTACADLNIEYIRLLRNEIHHDDVIYCEDISHAIEYLKNHDGAILSTIGSKELHQLTAINDYEKRVFARILPLAEAVSACISLGFHGSHLICMQGPFSYDLNLAMLKQYQCRFLLTKNSGDIGGFEEKIQAAKTANAQAIVIGRPTKETGLSFEDVKAYILNQFGFPQEKNKMLKTFFPLFINIENKPVLVVGGGTIATRRIKTLAKFNCHITVVAPTADVEVEKLHSQGKITYCKRCFIPTDLDGIFLAVAATNDRATNHEISILAKNSGIYHSIADCKEECDFYFPAVIETDDTVIGITAEGKSHKAAAETADKIRGALG